MKLRRQVLFDSTAFLGLNSIDETIRESSLTFFANQFYTGIGISLEQVGICDDVIWRYSRAIQDVYYPFMDYLHSEMNIRRIAYSNQDFQLAITSPILKDLSISKALVVAQVINLNGVLFTHDQQILQIVALSDFLFSEIAEEGSKFVEDIDALYKNAMVLRIPVPSSLDRIADTSSYI